VYGLQVPALKQISAGQVTPAQRSTQAEELVEPVAVVHNPDEHVEQPGLGTVVLPPAL